MTARPRSALPSLLFLLAGLALASPLAAQSTGRGFLFGPPDATLTLRGGFERAGAGSDVFAFVTEELTLGRRDFDGFLAGLELGLRLAPRIDATLGVAYSGRSSASEFRDWVDLDDAAIRQTTRFDRVPVSVGARAYLLPRGRTVGRYAWIPARVAPFVGGGAGAMWYRFRQAGDFVDFESFDIFPDALVSSGWTPEVHALGGADVSLSPRLALTGEARYSWAEAELERDFEGFDPIDLSGLSISIGLQLRH